MSGCISNPYRHDLDLLKGLAIIAVVLYHAGWCKSGYLGVDVFFVLNGYFVVPQIMRKIEDGQFKYWSFLEKKVFRLLPLVLIVSAFALAVGYWGMLPGDYRYLSEEVVASSTFANNILQAITTQNYWAAIYHKILMHNWFLGVLMQFYIIFPLLMLLFRRKMQIALIVLTFISQLLYLLPIDSIGNHYYLPQYRFWEMGLGGIVAIYPFRKSEALSIISLVCLLLMIFFGAFTIGEREMPYNLVGGVNTIRESFLPREILLLLTVLFTVLFLLTSCHEGKVSLYAQQSKLISPLGRMSLSVFLWHQPFFAFYRYLLADELSWEVLVLMIAIILLLSLFTYLVVESRTKINKISKLVLLFSFVTVNLFALWIYHIGGAVRDVPELGIRKGAADPTAFERYTDRIYQFDHDFSNSDKRRKILVIGNSFARDFANILLESSIADSIQLSYHYGIEDCPITRIQQCDRIYFFGWKHQVPATVWRNLRKGVEVWGIGTKNHGTSNGIFYKNRYRADYFAQRTTIRQDFHTINQKLKEEWGLHYIDLLSLTISHDSTVPVFTPDGYYITYDGKHLTPEGTRFYARHLVY